MSGFLWLASYPKSGNTWLRAVFTNLLGPGAGPVGINRLAFGPGTARRGFDDIVGYKASDLTADEIDAILPDVYRSLIAGASRPILCKVHDACVTLPDGQSSHPADVTAGVIYVIRNPIDVCVSWAHHTGRSDYDAVAAEMADPRHAIGEWGEWQHVQHRQVLLSWSQHALSWTDASHLPVHVMRYEDMHAAPVETFAAAAAFAGLPADHETVDRAVAFSSFSELQRQEREQGFGEIRWRSRPFFRGGRIGSWREALSDAQAARIISDHREVMQRFGYLTAAGEPVY